MDRSSTDRADIREAPERLRQVLDCGSPLPLSAQPPKAPEGRRTPRRWRDAAHSFLFLGWGLSNCIVTPKIDA
jgi:hypothetical protein